MIFIRAEICCINQQQYYKATHKIPYYFEMYVFTFGFKWSCLILFRVLFSYPK